MFELKNRKANTGASGYTMDISYNGRRLCRVNTWGFASCGVLCLDSFGYLDVKKEEEKEFADKFFEFLSDVDKDTWKPREAYMCLSDGQMNNQNWISALVKHPQVKRRDRFYNKSHGPNHMNLFRWSKAKDFKRVMKYA